MNSSALANRTIKGAIAEAEEALNTFDWFNANGFEEWNERHKHDFNNACIRLAIAVISLGKRLDEASKAIPS